MKMTANRKNEADSVRFRGISERSSSVAAEAVSTTILYCNVSVRTWTKVGIIISLIEQLLIGAFCIGAFCNDEFRQLFYDDDNSWESMKWARIVLLTGACAAAFSLVFPIFAWQGVQKGSNCHLTLWLIFLFLMIGLYLAGLAGTAYVFYTTNKPASSQSVNSTTPTFFWVSMFCFLWLLFVLTLRIFFLVVTMECRGEVRRKTEEEEEMEEKNSSGFYSQCQSPYPPLPLEDLELLPQNQGQYQYQSPYPYQQQNQHRNPNPNQNNHNQNNSHQFDYQEGLIEPRPYFPHKNSIFLYR